MAITANITMVITYTGDEQATDPVVWAANLISPGWIQVINLANGNNTITVPVGGGSTTVGVAIIPPTANANALVLKGVNGDSATLSLHLTNPHVQSLASSVTTFVINSTGITTGLRLFWF